MSTLSSWVLENIWLFKEKIKIRKAASITLMQKIDYYKPVHSQTWGKQMILITEWSGEYEEPQY